MEFEEIQAWRQTWTNQYEKNYTVPGLKEQCEKRKLEVSGRKADLVARLVARDLEDIGEEAFETVRVLTERSWRTTISSIFGVSLREAFRQQVEWSWIRLTETGLADAGTIGQRSCRFLSPLSPSDHDTTHMRISRMGRRMFQWRVERLANVASLDLAITGDSPCLHPEAGLGRGATAFGVGRLASVVNGQPVQTELSV